MTRKMTTKWGIIGTGNIAGQFARGLAAMEDAELVAVGSRSQASAQRFADAHGAARAHGSYEALAADPEVEAVYIATPHPMHLGNSLLCIEGGKAVLVEKPFTLNAKEAQTLIDAAKAKGVFVMEAMWTRFFPVMTKLKELVEGGAIGEVKLLQADFGFNSPFNPESRTDKPELGGGALLDVGVYPISLASFLLGTPTEVSSQAHLGPTGVDEQAAVILGHGGGALALLSTAIRATTPQEAVIMGSKGTIRVPAPWWKPESLTLSTSEETETFSSPLPHNGYPYEAEEVARCLREGLTESPTMPLAETLAVMKTLDTCRAQWGMTYPGE